ncbi:sugar phosphorylase [Vibrio sp. SCSIO 43137]|uniref:sugar phosphorylase n=1 Tax=Vibrio sp. SCSIO 43137 TaxID=3021011 RepID=UPI0023081068|nr:sugar phosphorylase [Vibrio sp. SCSIO 43137]WCE28688.1 sugar phosphorylase [Vibrio sp. SCSIO 43137]
MKLELKHLKNNLQQILAGVYSPAQLNQFLPELIERIAKFDIQSNRRLWVDQSDIMLISYGDSIKKQNEAPMRTLHEFLNRNTKDVLSAVHILPCFPYTSDDGFSVVDYWKINPELGDWKDVQALSQDFDLMFDGVINHMSKSSEWFTKFLTGDEEYKEFFIDANPDRDYSSVTRPRALPLLTTFETPSGPKHIWTTFSEDQVDLNFRNPEVLARIIELLLFYSEQGASFIRLDAIGFMWKELDTPCIHQPQCHALVQAMRAVMDSVAPHVKLITETNVPHKDNISYFGNGENEAHLVYQFPLPPLTLHTLQTGDSEKIVDWMASLEQCTDKTTFFNFLASHDGIGVRPVEGILSRQQVEDLMNIVKTNGGRVSFKDNGDGTQSPYELNINYYNAVSDIEQSEDVNIDRFMAAQSILVSMAGVPGIYVHSLLGSVNDSEGLEKLGYNRAINREKLDVERLEEELNTPEHRRNKILSRYKKMLTVRTTESAFAPSASQRVVKTDSKLITMVRDEQLAVVVNISNSAVEIDTTCLLDNLNKDILSGEAVDATVTLQPYQTMWLKNE